MKQKRKLKLDKLALENHPVIFTNTLFTLMDQDGDGNVSFEEFKLFWTKMKVLTLAFLFVSPLFSSSRLRLLTYPTKWVVLLH